MVPKKCTQPPTRHSVARRTARGRATRVKSFHDCPGSETVQEAYMLSDQMQPTIAQACVTVVTHDGHGQGVLVAGGLVLTAAHCVDYTTDGSMVLPVLGDSFTQEIQTTHGPLKVHPV